MSELTGTFANNRHDEQRILAEQARRRMSERVEQFQSEMLNNMAAQLIAAQSRVAELEADVLDHKQLIADKRDTIRTLAADNQRLRESITALQSWLEEEYGEHKRQIGDYARGYRDALDAADTKLDGLLKIKAAMGEGE